ncbi:cell division transport system ATP-binding protein [Natronincola peptidivorans]|uniref:Cell division transport system ATP-binding protein n=1 Tax=Natronincola peptidivorans TaxID=426128 RepID=A0A1I0CDJ1_9FIRM|nr:ATP-binding cassette domain-containing protein [Natronincola peptidivorans]SET17160.1 cell division transport system ATP-binding protein [Natronincola peptidivorans]
MIEAKEVCFKYPDGTKALKNINLKIEAGDIVYLTGPSGSGKTSLLKLFMGVEYPTAGTLEVLGQAIAKGQATNIRNMRMRIGPVFQEFRLIKGRTALENVMLGMRFLGIPPHQLKANASNALIKVGLEHKALSPVENLSWGQCQRVAIARAVARKPALILADEPTGNLDKDNALNILQLLTSFKDKDTAVVITTHATHLIHETKDIQIIEINDGSICHERLGLT